MTPDELRELENMPPVQQNGCVQLFLWWLSRLSTPMRRRVLERLLRKCGVSKSMARQAVMECK